MDNEETRKEVRVALLKYFDTDTIWCVSLSVSYCTLC